jgi:low affinity Fe/Cu permease
MAETQRMTVTDLFHHVARSTAHHMGQPAAFVAAIGIIVLWGVTGPLFGWSDTWQLIINTGTTIVTFLMVFLIQNTQNRDSKAMQLKLDELIRATRRARNTLLDLEDLSEEEVEKLRREFQQLAERKRLKRVPTAKPPA